MHQHTQVASFWITRHKTPCCLVLVQWTLFISEPVKVHHRSRVATDSTSSEKKACTHDTSLYQRYITNSKEYLTISHISLKYFELMFLQLQPVILSCKLITIWLSYKREKGCIFYETPHTIKHADKSAVILHESKTAVLVKDITYEVAVEHNAEKKIP